MVGKKWRNESDDSMWCNLNLSHNFALFESSRDWSLRTHLWWLAALFFASCRSTSSSCITFQLIFITHLSNSPAPCQSEAPKEDLGVVEVPPLRNRKSSRCWLYRCSRQRPQRLVGTLFLSPSYQTVTQLERAMCSHLDLLSRLVALGFHCCFLSRKFSAVVYCNVGRRKEERKAIISRVSHKPSAKFDKQIAGVDLKRVSD